MSLLLLRVGEATNLHEGQQIRMWPRRLPRLLWGFHLTADGRDHAKLRGQLHVRENQCTESAGGEKGRDSDAVAHGWLNSETPVKLRWQAQVDALGAGLLASPLRGSSTFALALALCLGLLFELGRHCRCVLIQLLFLIG